MISDCYLHFRDVGNDASMPVEYCVFESKTRSQNRCVYLDSSERARKVTQILTSYMKPYVFSRIQEEVVQGPDANIRLEFSHLVKDIQVIVERVDDPVRVIVPEKLLLNGHTHYDLNSMMTTDIIPQKSNECIHYLPFCQNPANPEYTSSINFSMLDHACLILKALKADEKYKVTIMARHYNNIVFTSDRITLQHQ